MKKKFWIQIKMTAIYQIVLKIINLECLYRSVYYRNPHSRAIFQIEFSVFSIFQDSMLSKRESYIKGDLESFIKLAFSNFNQFEMCNFPQVSTKLQCCADRAKLTATRF